MGFADWLSCRFSALISSGPIAGASTRIAVTRKPYNPCPDPKLCTRPYENSRRSTALLPNPRSIVHRVGRRLVAAAEERTRVLLLGWSEHRGPAGSRTLSGMELNLEQVLRTPAYSGDMSKNPHDRCMYGLRRGSAPLLKLLLALEPWLRSGSWSAVQPLRSTLAAPNLSGSRLVNWGTRA